MFKTMSRFENHLDKCAKNLCEKACGNCCECHLQWFTLELTVVVFWEEGIKLSATKKETRSIILPVQMPVHFSKKNNTMPFCAVFGICQREIFKMSICHVWPKVFPFPFTSEITLQNDNQIQLHLIKLEWNDLMSKKIGKLFAAFLLNLNRFITDQK